MKTLKLTLVVTCLLALVLALGAMTASAAGEQNATPAGAPYIDNQAHAIDAKASLWYRFDYVLGTKGEREPITLKLVQGNKSGVGFEIYEPQDMPIFWEEEYHPVIGRGTASSQACDAGRCPSDDLTWVGAFSASGTYYVRIVNKNSSATTALLTIEGNGVRLAPRPAPASAPPLAAVNMDDPSKATLIDGKVQNIPANAAVWYRFDYQVKDNGERPTKTIALLYGNKSGMHFEVYSPEILNQWWDQDPIGKGTAYKVNCDTGVVVGQSDCESEDLTWTGSFGVSGTYYVRVVNDQPNAANAQLTLR